MLNVRQAASATRMEEIIHKSGNDLSAADGELLVPTATNAILILHFT